MIDRGDLRMVKVRKEEKGKKREGKTEAECG